MKKTIRLAGLVLVVGFLWVMFGNLKLFDADKQIQIAQLENLKDGLNADLRFIALDYMNEPEVKKCRDLRDKLKDTQSTWEIIAPQAGTEIACDQDVVKDLFLNELVGAPEYYDLGEQGMLIAANNKNGFKLVRYFDPQTCGFDYETRFKNMLTTEHPLVIKIDQAYFLASEWFSKGRFVFYYLDKDSEFDEVNCRFDVI